jgi:signal transduction histidine kinase
MLPRRSIRWRLTLWYVAVLAGGMALFGAGTWLTLREVLLGNRHRGLDQRLTAFTAFLTVEARGDAISDLREEAREYSTGLPEGHGLVVRQLDGRLIFAKPAAPGPVLERRKKVHVRGHSLELELRVPLADFYRTLSILGRVMISVLPMVLAIAVAGGWWLAKRALAPVGAMTAEARFLNASDLSARLSVPRTRDELQQLAEAWNELLGRIEASVRSVTRFTADAAHELRTPVTVIRTSAELALRHPRSAESYQQTLLSIQQETEEMTELLERLLLLARGDAGQWGIRLDTVFADDLLRSLQPAIISLASSKQITVDLVLPTGPAMIWADESAIRRLIMILSDNAIKYTPAGGQFALRLKTPGPTCVLEVEDTGCGIPPKDLPYVFERFYRSDPARTPGMGVGLGLAIARAIVDAHQGTIEVFSEAGKGSLFRVCLPCAQPSTAGHDDRNVNPYVTT